MPVLCLVHLLWGPFGPEAAARFGAAYRAVEPGVEHRFVAVYNGFRGDVSGVRDALGVQADEEVHIDGRVQDLIAYRRALDAVECDRVAFVNGWAEPIADGWLATLSAALDGDGVGIAGCTASWESPASAAPPHLKLHRRGLFEPFPNPHVRTNGWAIEADLARSLVWDVRRRKVGAESLESGKQGLTRQVQARGLRPVMVSRQGRRRGRGLAGGPRVPLGPPGGAPGARQPHAPVRRRRSAPEGVPGADGVGRSGPSRAVSRRTRRRPCRGRSRGPGPGPSGPGSCGRPR